MAWHAPQAEQMMRDFDDIMIPLQLNLTSQGCIDKDVRMLVYFQFSLLPESRDSSMVCLLVTRG